MPNDPQTDAEQLQQVRVTYDTKADKAFVWLGGTAIQRTMQLAEARINLALDASGKLVGIEILKAERRLPPNVLANASIADSPAMGMKIVPGGHASGGKTGEIESVKAKDINAILGFKSKNPGDGKVKHQWDFTVDGVSCSIWSWYDSFSTTGPHEIFTKLFGEKYRAT